MNILFICTGNTCRSPMAEGYLNSKKLYGVTAQSRGIAADGSPVSENSKTVMAEAGIDISGHVSRQVTDTDIDEADKIICLSRSHAAALAQAGVPAFKLSVLGGGISDPFGGSPEVYRNCRDEIFRAVDKLCEEGFFGNFRIVPITEKHIAPIAKLEKICFSEPWSAEGLIESYRSGTKFFVAENDRHIIGYVGIKPVIDEGYITNVAVYPAYRRQGVGTALLKRVFEFAVEEKLRFVSLEVRVSNSAAVSLYQKLGFITEGRRKDFYRNPREDALIMTKRFDYPDEDSEH